MKRRPTENDAHLFDANCCWLSPSPPAVSLITMCLLALAGQLFPLSAAAIISGDLIILRVGDGSGVLTNAAKPTFLDEYTPAGVLVQTIAIPSNGNRALTLTGDDHTEGIMSRSQNGSTLIFAGYRKDAGGSNPSIEAPATTNRVIGSIGLDGMVNTSIALTDPTGTIRSATSVDGSSSFYFSTSAAVRYVASPRASSTSISIDALNSQQVNLSENTLFASTGSTSISTKVQSYGTLPTGTTSPTPIVTLATSAFVIGFSLFDLSPSIPGDDTLYALSTNENMLRKYVFDGSAWSLFGSISAPFVADLTGTTDGTNVTLYLTQPSGFFSFTDSSGYAGTLSGSLGFALAVAKNNTAFRGIGLIAIPEPGAAVLTALGLMLFSLRRTIGRQ